MSLSTINVILGRIKLASPLSPIAVLRTRKPCGPLLDAVFGATVAGQLCIKHRPDDVVGVFDGTMDQAKIGRTLNAALAARRRA